MLLDIATVLADVYYVLCSGLVGSSTAADWVETWVQREDLDSKRSKVDADDGGSK
jgi:hypothetical protein